MNSENTWVTSAGGPLILIPQSVCHHWGGAPRTYPDDEGDYGRACEVDGYVGLIDVGGVQALVLGDMPARTTFLPQHNVLVREIAGDEDDANLSALVADLLPRVEWESGPTWTINEPVVLFDSVYESTEIATEEHLRIDLQTGEYLIEAGYIDVPSEYLILVRLLRDRLPPSAGRDGQPAASNARGEIQC
ncbi:Imm21 family immunity protein [Streptomyces sp. NBC_01262]|uniref:Imm21 family immunity protein n=1 Tax=Streptomyces sp. NBC_01262 TaxID=2903803 RepID=UPI002E366DED|nr:Imm21 family immunity protein [Streptomyces sp. NBC_01262]